MNRSGTERTSFLDDAMKFENQEDAERYLIDHADEIEQIGSGACPQGLYRRCGLMDGKYSKNPGL